MYKRRVGGKKHWGAGGTKKKKKNTGMIGPEKLGEAGKQEKSLVLR